jgi:hypothetical protein
LFAKSLGAHLGVKHWPLLAGLMFVILTPSISFAQQDSAVSRICAAEAGNARTIAQDRDSGISKGDELKQTDRIVDAMPPERQAFAQAELGTFVDRLYGPYAKMPPAEVYTKYLAYCMRRAGQSTK